jgi:hypothetical protein
MGMLNTAGGWFNQLTGRNQANDAARRQQELMSQAQQKYSTFDTPQYDQAQRGVMDRLLSGGPAQVDQGQFQREYVQPMTQNFEQQVLPGVNQSMAHNFWSSTRQQAQQNANQALGNQMNQGFLNLQAQANQNQIGALQQLLQNKQNSANALMGQASAVRPTPSVLQGLGNVLTTGGGIMDILGKGKVLMGTNQGTQTQGTQNNGVY